MCLSVYHILFVHLFISEQLDCFYLLAVVNNAALNMDARISLSPAFILHSNLYNFLSSTCFMFSLLFFF